MAANQEIPPAAVAAVGDASALALLSELVALAPTNREDPARERWEKPHYARTAHRIAEVARQWGLTSRIFDPVDDPVSSAELHGVPRPNVIVDLDVGAADRVLILAHYDVVPVPAEQLVRWGSPPHVLTPRPDGRLYGRGSNDDLGSGVVASLLAMKRLTRVANLRRNVRLLVCCDEETGGEGGIEALKHEDRRRAPTDPQRTVAGSVALIPDGDPHATGGSSGVAFLDAGLPPTTSLAETLRYGQFLVSLHEVARQWRSRFASPDWPDHLAPEPVITGRATVTQVDIGPSAVVPSGPGPTSVRLAVAHAESEAANQIAQAVTLVFDGPKERLGMLRGKLEHLVSPPFHLSTAGATAVHVPPDGLALQLIGLSAHGGYPHRGHNPVPAALDLLVAASASGLVDPTTPAAATFSVDLRLLPEMSLAEGVDPVLDKVRAWARVNLPRATIDAPPGRCRRGYALPPDHPEVLRLQRLLEEAFGATGVYGEYGGTDASSLADLVTPSGAPLPALVFGSMDRSAQIHDADESVDPVALGRIARVIEQFIAEP